MLTVIPLNKFINEDKKYILFIQACSKVIKMLHFITSTGVKP